MDGEIPGHDLYETLTTIRARTTEYGWLGGFLPADAASELVELLEQTANAILRRWAAELRFFEHELTGNPVDVLRRYNNYEWANDQVRDVVAGTIAGAAADHADHGYDDLRRHVEAHQQFEQATLEEVARRQTHRADVLQLEVVELLAGWLTTQIEKGATDG